jgi:hypothetical protein
LTLQLPRKGSKIEHRLTEDNTAEVQDRLGLRNKYQSLLHDIDEVSCLQFVSGIYLTVVHKHRIPALPA